MPCLPAHSKPLLAPDFLELRKFEVVGVAVLILEGWASIHACQVNLVGKPEEWYRKKLLT